MLINKRFEGSIIIYTKNLLMSWSDDKELLSGVIIRSGRQRLKLSLNFNHIHLFFKQVI